MTPPTRALFRLAATALIAASTPIPAAAHAGPQQTGAGARDAAAVNPAGTTAEPESEAPQQLLAAVHAHSAASSGAYSLAELARLARRSGLDVVMLAENLGYDVRYAPAGVRVFAEATLATPTLERYGIERFLRRLQEARNAEPDLLLLAGVEVPPFYHWTGSLLRGNLTLHDAQRNLLLFPPPGDPAPRLRAFLRGIPAVGNPYHRQYDIRSLARALPGIACVALSIAALARAGSPGPRRRPPWRSAVLMGVGALLLYASFPFSVPSTSPYEAHERDRVARDVLAYARRNGALSFWSMPEAVDFRDRRLGPLTVRLSTAPYPEVLAMTHDYTGFGGVYADTVTSWEPGGEWDRALGSFQAGHRSTPPWIIGESAFHATGHAGKSIGDVLTVVLTGERTEEAVFAALSCGRSYAARRDEGHPDLRLQEYFLAAIAPRPVDAPRAVARSGQKLIAAAAGDVDVELNLNVQDASGKGTTISVEVVRDGHLIERVEGTTPFAYRLQNTLEAGTQSAYYRVVVRATRAAYLVSNPIFIDR